MHVGIDTGGTNVDAVLADGAVLESAKVPSGESDPVGRALDRVLDGRMVASLAGGYGVEGGLPYTNLAVIAALAGLDTSDIREPAIYDPPSASPDVGDVIERVRDRHSQYWDL